MTQKPLKVHARSNILVPKGTRIGNFEVIQLIGEGGYGQIYEIVQNDTLEHFAMKVEDLSTRKKGLQKEISVLKDCKISTLLPRIIDSGITADFRFMIMELLGPSLSQLARILPNRTLSKYSILHIGKHMIECIRALHDKGYIHRDIKPSNFLIRPDRQNPCCIIDFGLAKKYINENGQIKPPRKNPGYAGTAIYCSVNAHEENELSRKDDLISWFYAMVELSEGKLPWPGSDNKKETVRLKKTLTPEELCKSLTPEFIEIYRLISSLEFEDAPNYSAIIDLLQLSINNQNFIIHLYDWERLNQSELSKISVISLKMEGKPISQEEKSQEVNGCCIIS